MSKELERLQKKEYESAAQEAAKDLEVDYGDQPKEKQQEQQTIDSGQTTDDMSITNAVGRADSLSKVLQRGSIENLANTATGLDSLIGASTA